MHAYTQPLHHFMTLSWYVNLKHVNSMMHANACCTCNLISTCTSLITTKQFFSHLPRYCISRMHHISTPRACKYNGNYGNYGNRGIQRVNVSITNVLYISKLFILSLSLLFQTTKWQLIMLIILIILIMFIMLITSICVKNCLLSCINQSYCQVIIFSLVQKECPLLC